VSNDNSRNTLGVSVNIPSQLQSAITLAFIVCGTAISVGAVGLVFRELNKPPFGGVWVDNWQSIGAAAGFLSGLVSVLFRLALARVPSRKEVALLNDNLRTASESLSALTLEMSRIGAREAIRDRDATLVKMQIAHLYGLRHEPLPREYFKQEEDEK